MRPPTTPLSARNIARRIARGLDSQCRDCHAPLRIVDAGFRRWVIDCPQCETKPQTLIARKFAKAYFQKPDPVTQAVADEAERWQKLIATRDAWWLKRFDEIQHLVAGEVARRRHGPPRVGEGVLPRRSSEKK